MHVGDERARLGAATSEAVPNEVAPLAAGESVWATVPGATGDLLVATDLRLLHARRTPDGRMAWRGWAFEELSEITPIGGRPGETPGRFVILDASRSAPLISFAIDPARREDAMQAVTIVQLLIARARRHRPVSPPGELHEAIDVAVDRARAAQSADSPGQPPLSTREAREAGARPDAAPPGRLSPRSGAPTRHSPR